MKLTEKGTIVYEILKNKGASEENPMTSKDVAKYAGLPPRSVPGVLMSLYNKNLVGKTGDTPRKFYII